MALHDFRSQRLYLDGRLSRDARVEATREQANYLVNVLRMKDGASILVFNGIDGEWRASVHPTGRKKCELVIGEQVRTQPQRPRLTYCFAPLKQARLDYMIQKAVEMGVGTLQPVVTRHTQVSTLSERRVTSNAVEAAEQCGVLHIPNIRKPVALEDLPESLPADCHLIVCDEDAGDAAPDELKVPAGSELAVLVGPEGGFSQEERAMLRGLDNVGLLGLGPRILRADTAAVAALAIVQYRLGDWYGGNGRQQQVG